MPNVLETVVTVVRRNLSRSSEAILHESHNVAEGDDADRSAAVIDKWYVAESVQSHEV